MERESSLFDKAYQIAEKAHAGQKDKAGQPYLAHPVHVAADLDSVELKVIGLLHDVLEDSDWTREELIAEGIPEELVRVVDMLTHDEDVFPDYMDYIYMISKDPMARKVKMADLRHNMDLTRIPNPKQKDYDRVKKYQKAYAFLENAENQSFIKREVL